MPSNQKVIRVAGAAIIHGGCVLVARRPPCDVAYKSLKWEFPGGKIEQGETVEDAIKREIREELGCRITTERCLTEIEYDYPDFTLRMTVLICRLTEGEWPRCLEHNALRWCTVAELSGLDWAAADSLCYPLLAQYLNGS